MKKLMGIFAVIVVTALMLTSSNATAEEKDECGEIPKFSCPIWNVEITVGFPDNTMTCTTGGQYKCDVRPW